MSAPTRLESELSWFENISKEFDRSASLLMDLSHCSREISPSGMLIVAMSLQETCDALRTKLDKMNGGAS